MIGFELTELPSWARQTWTQQSLSRQTPHGPLMATGVRRFLGRCLALVAVYSCYGVCGELTDEPVDGEALYWQRLDEIRTQRRYPDDAARGTFKRFHHVDGFDATFHYTVDIPDSYDPEQPTDLHIYLHGGVGISTKRISNIKLRRLKKLRVDDAISVYPSAWRTAKWWYESQANNIVKIINSLKESYNIDDNRVFMHGLSDGAGGAYYFASHLPTPFAGFIALVGSPHVLREKHRVFGTTFPGNFVNKPIFAVNTKDDHLFPADTVERLFDAVNDNEGDVTFHAMPGDHFGMPWLSTLKTDYAAFVDSKTRNPYPDSLYWQIDESTAFTRIHWLILHNTRGEDTESALVAKKSGNTLYLSSKNIDATTVLISSDHFDLNENVQIWSNGEVVFDEKVHPDVRVLDKWFALDQDRSMLFASEIRLDMLP